MNYIAYVTKGLEKIAKDEIEHNLKDSAIKEVRDKYIFFEFQGHPAELEKLRTVNDVSVLIIKDKEFKSNDILKFIDIKKLQEIFDWIKKFRSIKNELSITVSVYKNPDVRREELATKLGKTLSKESCLAYSESDHSNFDLRINVEENRITAGVKLFSESLYKRNNKAESIFGAIKPTIAAAMIYKPTKGREEGLRFVDNFCGSGTFLREAAILGFDVYGGDIGKSAVNVTLENGVKLGINQSIKAQDATNTSWANNMFDVAASNIPWGKQVNHSNISDLISKSVKEYARILKPDGTLATISTKPEIVIKKIKSYFPNHSIEQIQIGYLGQRPTIVFAETKR